MTMLEMHFTKCMLAETGMVLRARTRVSTPYVYTVHTIRSVSEWCPDSEHGQYRLAMALRILGPEGDVRGRNSLGCEGEALQTCLEMPHV